MGAAGTGKSTMINYISSLFKDKQKIFLANTNPAVENLRRKVTAEHAEFVTITKFLSRMFQMIAIFYVWMNVVQ